MSTGYYEVLNDDTLLDNYRDLSEKVRLYTSALGHIEMILRQRLETCLACQIDAERKGENDN